MRCHRPFAELVLPAAAAALVVALAVPRGAQATASWHVAGPQDSSMFGSAACSAGDVNRDGYDDVLVAARFEDHPERDEGRAYLYLGGPAGLSTSPAWTAESDQPDARFGESAAGAGDVNGDGYDDVIVGAVLYDTTQGDAGKVFLYLGRPSGLDTAPAWSWSTNQGSSYTGNAVAAAGDVNHDGYADVLVAAHYWDNPLVNEGGAFLFLGGPAGLAATPAWTASGGQSFADFGFALAGADDVNHDGHDDVVVSAIAYDVAVVDQGRVFVYFGGPAGLSATPAWFVDGDTKPTVEAGHFGGAVAGAGDVDGDGFADVLLGYEHYVVSSVSEGRAELFRGGLSGPAASPVWIQDGVIPGAHVGHAVAPAGDVNRDGFADILVGAWQDTDGGEWGEGRAYLFLGGPGGPSASPVWTAAGGVPYAGFGGHVGSAGDVNGDGFPDWLVSAFGFDNGVRPRGFAEVFEGPGVVGAPLPGGGHASPGIRVETGRIVCTLAEARRGRIDIVDARGSLVASLAAGWLRQGETVLRWDGRAHRGGRAAAGVYRAVLAADGLGRFSAPVFLLR